MLPEALRRLEPAPPYPVATSEALRELCRIADEKGGCRAAGALPTVQREVDGSRSHE